MEINGKKIDDAGYAAAMARFEHGMGRGKVHHSRKIMLDFDELLGYFANDCMSFSDIARIGCGGAVGSGAVRSVYNKYFRELFPGGRTGKQRRKVCVIKCRNVAAKNAKGDFSDDDILGWIAELGARAGCVIERALRWPSAKIPVRSPRGLLIDGVYHEVHRSGGSRDFGCGVRYSRFTMSRRALERITGIVAVQENEGHLRAFLIPSRTILAAFGNQKGRRLKFYIPARKQPAKTNTPRVDWWKHEWPAPGGEETAGSAG